MDFRAPHRLVKDVLIHESGRLGISGITHDMRGLLEAAGERAAQRARLRSFSSPATQWGACADMAAPTRDRKA